MIKFAQRHPITDICFLVSNVERAASFYTEKLGFKPRRRAEGFADFKGAGITLALWEIDHITQQIGLSSLQAPPGTHKACAAIEVASFSEVDAAYRELSALGVIFRAAPADYDWNARCCYFTDLDDNIWEIYAWGRNGPIGDLPVEHHSP